MRDAPDSFMPLNIGIYLADTTHLNSAEHGAYLLLLMAYWRNGGPLRDDDSELHAITKLSQEQWFASRKRIRKFFYSINVDGEQCLGQKRAELELAAARERFEKKSNAGKAGNTKRWGNRTRMAVTAASQPASQTDRIGIADQSQTISQTDRHIPNTSTGLKPDGFKPISSLRSDSSDHGSDVRPESAASQSPEKPARPKKSRDDFGPEFAAWYQKYPRHEARGDAEKAYRAARKSGAAADELLAGAERYADSRRGENPQYTKLPATWVRSKCWLDEPAAASQTADEKPLSSAELAATRREYLRSWAAGKPWIQNISGNGVWRDQYGIGPPPDDPGTLVTADDLAAVPDAAKRVNQPRRIPAE